MAVITISREFGSEGLKIGQQVAQQLGYHLVDKRTIEAVLEQYGFVQFDELYKSTPGFWARTDRTNLLLISMLNKILQAFARHGQVVLLGRGGYIALSGYADVVNVRIQAPFSVRVQRVMERENLSNLHQAEELVKENDRVRSAFIQAFYGVRWDTVSDFNLVIDTSLVPPDVAVRWLVETIQALEPQKFEKAVTTQTIEVDPVLAEAVSAVLIPV
jgi:cytidylate kinase